MIVVYEGEKTPLALFAQENPRWLDDSTWLTHGSLKPVTLANAEEVTSLPKHPFFDEWREEIQSTACRIASLVLAPGSEPAVLESLSGGKVCFLEDPTWPTCRHCGKNLDVCFQLAPEAMTSFIDTSISLVALYCFDCPQQEGASYVRWAKPSHRLENPAPNKPGRAARITVGDLRWDYPSSQWFAFESEFMALDGAARLLEGGEIETADGRTIEVALEYDGWVRPEHGYETELIPARRVTPVTEFRTFLGGFPSWDQAGGHPECPSCKNQMKHLVDYPVEQFLDGALHVFICGCESPPKLVLTVES